MLIATSLMYSKDNLEIEKQKKAMQTWKDIGFRVISSNVIEEIEVLREVFPDVFFVELKRSGKELTGKPFPFIYDMLQALKGNTQKEDDICGIVNSDIFLKNISAEEIQAYFRVSDNRVLIMHRYDIDEEEDTKGEYYFSGIDVFFFERKYISIFPDKGFMLGRPEWDHWFLYEADNAGMQILEIKNKLAFHIKHRQRWTASESNQMASKQKNQVKKQSFDEEYYYRTNELMANLQNRILLGSPEGIPSETVIKQDGFWDDGNRENLMRWEKESFSIEDVPESIGVLYFKDNRPFRLCALHRQVKENVDGTFSLGEILENERDKGNILKYIDFKDFDFVKSLGKVYVYPAGRAARLLIDCLDAYHIPVLGMVDRDESLWGKTYMGKEIFGLSVLDDAFSYDHVIIASNLYVKEIYEGLSKSIDSDKLIVL